MSTPWIATRVDRKHDYQGVSQWYFGTHLHATDPKNPYSPDASFSLHGYCSDENVAKILAVNDLLAALRQALNFIENNEREFGEPYSCGEAARAAIAKAETLPC